MDGKDVLVEVRLEKGVKEDTEAEAEAEAEGEEVFVEVRLELGLEGKLEASAVRGEGRKLVWLVWNKGVVGAVEDEGQVRRLINTEMNMERIVGCSAGIFRYDRM